MIRFDRDVLREGEQPDLVVIEFAERLSAYNLSLIHIFTGLMASGKSTVSDLLAKSIEKCVHLRGDVFRKMIKMCIRDRNAAESIPEDGHIRKRTVLLILLTA